MALSEKRKADREKMAAVVIELATALGITAKRDPYGIEASISEITIELTCNRGVTVEVDFDGESNQPDTFVLTWNAPSKRSDADPRVCFSNTFGSMVNEYHRGKSTRVAYGFVHLCEILRGDIGKLIDGSAFDDDFAAKFQASLEHRRTMKTAA